MTGVEISRNLDNDLRVKAVSLLKKNAKKWVPAQMYGMPIDGDLFIKMNFVPNTAAAYKSSYEYKPGKRLAGYDPSWFQNPPPN